MKKSTLALLVGSVLLATGAHAAPLDINIYGASAQFTFWDNLGSTYLTSQGCSSIVGPVYDASGKHGIISGTGTGACASGINLRYSSKSSYDGVFAAMGSCNGLVGCNPDPDACGNNQQRKLITSTSNTALTCQNVTIGASDVAPASFTQVSHGQNLGPLNGGNKDFIFSGIKTPANVEAKHGGVIVPFGFFLNNSIQLSKCSSTAAAHAGAQCGSDADCGGTAGACVSGNVDNISRAMAVNIFSGNSAYFWSDFGAGYKVTGTTPQSDDYIVACLRHAGSGTHSTLDYAVMNSHWGGSTATNETPVAGGPTEQLFFNAGGTDLMNCVNGSGAWTGKGAIGYADADILQPTKSFNPDHTVKITNTPYTSTYGVAYNGYLPTRVNVRNGAYDFFTNEWLFINKTTYPAGSTAYTQFTNLINFASDPANIQDTAASTFYKRADYWTTAAEMHFNKGTDQDYPSYVSAAIPQTP